MSSNFSLKEANKPLHLQPVSYFYMPFSKYPGCKGLFPADVLKYFLEEGLTHTSWLLRNEIFLKIREFLIRTYRKLRKHNDKRDYIKGT